MKRLALLALLAPLAAAANPHEQEIQRALIQRDQQSAEFAAGADRGSLEILHQRQLMERPLHPDPNVARELRAYERQRLAQEREGFVLRLPPPKPNSLSSSEPLPLPGGPRHGVEPVAPDGVGR